MKNKDLRIEIVQREKMDFEQTRVPAVKITHKPSGKTATADYGKSIEQNKDRALELLKMILGE